MKPILVVVVALAGVQGTKTYSAISMGNISRTYKYSGRNKAITHKPKVPAKPAPTFGGRLEEKKMEARTTSKMPKKWGKIMKTTSTEKKSLAVKGSKVVISRKPNDKEGRFRHLLIVPRVCKGDLS